MDNVSSNKMYSLEERINGLIVDSPDILYKLNRLSTPKGQPIEIVTELPSAIDPDIILGNVQRWREVQKYFDCELRIYAWTYNTEVEKYLLGCVQHMSKIAVTTLPTYLKEKKIYGT